MSQHHKVTSRWWPPHRIGAILLQFSDLITCLTLFQYCCDTRSDEVHFKQMKYHHSLVTSPQGIHLVRTSSTFIPNFNVSTPQSRLLVVTPTSNSLSLSASSCPTCTTWPAAWSPASPHSSRRAWGSPVGPCSLLSSCWWFKGEIHLLYVLLNNIP